ncbi:PqqD family peptide modification chaperone [Clostridium felsineum]|uniref:PqqD family peptide modification chaperone n=1 Tax=Clostridium felsineum TaxID=36839 RepID=UPI00098CA307|nr:PqqD family peptide modification chaperone [Clostridium felsineum]URZ14075.1 hypothetical protein CLFE_000500 [Clostridium felsineum DSM 794]
MLKMYRNKTIKYAIPRVKLDGDIGIFFYNPNTGKDFVANHIGTLIWYIIDEGKSLEDISKYISEMYKLYDYSKLLNDITSVCKIMCKNDLIKIVEE